MNPAPPVTRIFTRRYRTDTVRRCSFAIASLETSVSKQDVAWVTSEHFKVRQLGQELLCRQLTLVLLCIAALRIQNSSLAQRIGSAPEHVAFCALDIHPQKIHRIDLMPRAPGIERRRRDSQDLGEGDQRL